MHVARADDRAVAFLHRHDGVVGFHTSGLSGTSALVTTLAENDLARRSGGRQVASLLQCGVVVGELVDAADTDDVGA